MPGFANGVMYADNVRFDGADGPAQVTLDGQLLIGSTVAPNIRVATLTAGAGVSIVNGAGTITIASSASAVFTSIAVPTLATADTGWFADAPLTLTLPVTAGLVDGDQVIVICKNAGPVIIQANAGQVIQVSAVTSAVAGTATNTASGDSLSLRFQVTSLSWTSEATSGNWTVI